MNYKELNERFRVGDEVWACSVHVNNNLSKVNLEGTKPIKGICAPWGNGCMPNLQYMTEKYKGFKGISLFVPLVNGEPLWSAAKSTLLYLFGETEEECRNVYMNLLEELLENTKKAVNETIKSL